MADAMLPSLALSLAMLAAGLLLLRRGWRQKRSDQIARRLGRGYEEKIRPRRARGRMREVLAEADIDMPNPLLAAMAVPCVLMLLVTAQKWGWFAGAMAAAGLGAAGYGGLRWRTERRVRKMVSQMPAFLDHMIRSLKSGRTLADAMLLAMERSPTPLKDALAAPRRSIELGVALGEAIEEFARRYRRQEFHVLALGIRVNQRYGGNASELLDSLILLIRDQERAARQLRAMTGETRISALVLALLPVGLAGYIFVSNPGFFLGLWYEETGRYLLLAAVGLQLLGCYLLWRMLRSV